MKLIYLFFKFSVIQMKFVLIYWTHFTDILKKLFFDEMSENM